MKMPASVLLLMGLWVSVESPADLRVVATAQTTYLISWDAADRADGYYVQIGSAPGATDRTIDSGAALQVATTLTSTSYVRVVGYNVVGIGPPSNEVTVVITPVPVDCVLGPWTFQSATAWGTCSPQGVQTRIETWVRAVVTPPQNGGAACGPTSETRLVSQSCTPPVPDQCVSNPLVPVVTHWPVNKKDVLTYTSNVAIARAVPQFKGQTVTSATFTDVRGCVVRVTR